MIRINNSLRSFSTNKHSFFLNKNLAFFSVLFLFLGSVILFTIQKFSSVIGHVTYYCRSFIDANMIPIPYYLRMMPLAFLFLIFMISFVKFIILIFKIEFLKHTLNSKIITKNKISELIKSLGLEKRASVIRANERFAFCLGIRKPKIYISTRLIAELSVKEVEAVLRHEQYHLENHDTFTMIIASTSHSLFPFFPILGDLIKRYRVEREIAADNFAVVKVGDSYHLVSALKKLLAFPTISTVTLAAIAEQDTLEPRIYSILNKSYSRKQFRLKHLFITILSFLVIGIVIVFPVHARKINHEKNSVIMLCTDGKCMNACANGKNLDKLYSGIKNEKVSNSTPPQPFTPSTSK